MRPVGKRGGGGLFRNVAARGSGALACLACCLVLAGPSRAQSLTNGPLSPAGTGGPAPSGREKLRPETHVKAHAKKAHAARAANAKAAEPENSWDRAGPPASTPVPRDKLPVEASDPLKLGLKWNGSNDSVGQTRSQNYGGTAVGTGASVGLGYHF